MYIQAPTAVPKLWSHVWLYRCWVCGGARDMILTVRDTQSERAESINTQHENDAGAHEIHYPLSESSTGGILPTVDSSSSLSSGYQ